MQNCFKDEFLCVWFVNQPFRGRFKGYLTQICCSTTYIIQSLAVDDPSNHPQFVKTAFIRVLVLIWIIIEVSCRQMRSQDVKCHTCHTVGIILQCINAHNAYNLVSTDRMHYEPGNCNRIPGQRRRTPLIFPRVRVPIYTPQNLSNPPNLRALINPSQSCSQQWCCEDAFLANLACHWIAGRGKIEDDVVVRIPPCGVFANELIACCSVWTWSTSPSPKNNFIQDRHSTIKNKIKETRVTSSTSLRVVYHF